MATIVNSVSRQCLLRLSSLSLDSLPVWSRKVQPECQAFSTSGACSKSRSSVERRRKYSAADTRLKTEEPARILSRRGYGGSRKLKAMHVNSGFYTLESLDLGTELPILDVVYSGADSGHLKQKIIVKGTIVKLDASLLKSKVEERLKGESQQEASQTDDEDVKGTIRRNFLEAETVYGKVTTRPGQVGVCNGHILEGLELEHFLETLSNPSN